MLLDAPGFVVVCSAAMYHSLQQWGAHAWVGAICLLIFLVIWCLFLRFNRSPWYYFDAQDFLEYEKGGGRLLPASASKSSFEPLLKHYISVTQLVVTIAAASITFGGNQSSKSAIPVAKIFLAFSVFYGALSAQRCSIDTMNTLRTFGLTLAIGTRRSRRWGFQRSCASSSVI